MKTIKYFAMLFAAGALCWGCSDDDDLNTQNKDKTKPTVTITQGTIADGEFSFTLAASAEAAQYAYVVFKGKDNAAPTAHDIVIDEVAESYKSGAFNVADAASQQIAVACSSAADYQIFAAAITSTGLLSEVTELAVYVPDTKAPAPKSFKASGNTVTVTYSEDIQVGSTGRATVQYIQWGVGKMLEAVEIPAENISTSGAVATIKCPKPGNGAGYIVSYTAGMFEDLSGNKCGAMTSGYDNDKGYVGIGWDDANVSFPIEDSYFVAQPEDADYNTPTTTVDFVFPFDVYDAEAKNAVQVIFNEPEGIFYINADYTLGEDSRTVKVTLPKVPTAMFDVQVAAGAFYDIWGNESAAFTVAADKLRYSNFQVTIQTGTYKVSYTGHGASVANPNSGTPFTLDLVKLDDTQYVLYNKWFGLYQAPMLVGTVDYANNRLVFDGKYYTGSAIKDGAFSGMFYYYDEAKTQLLAFWSDGESGTDPIYVSFDENGYMTAITYFDYTIHDAKTGRGVAVFDAVTDGTMEYVPQQADAPAMKFGAVKADRLPAAAIVNLKK